MLETVYRNEAICHLYVLKSLNDSERDVKIFKIQGVSSLQVLRIQKQLQKVVYCYPEIIK
jgi:hypothetical protein